MNLDKYFTPHVKYPSFSDKVLWRPLAKLLVKPLLKTGLSANEVSGLKLVAYIVTALMYMGRLWILGGLFLVTAIALDYVDGMVARIRKTASEYGNRVDYMTEQTGIVLTIIGLTFGLCGEYAYPLVVALGGLLLVFRVGIWSIRKNTETPVRIPMTTVFSYPLSPWVYWTHQTLPLLLFVGAILNIMFFVTIIWCVYMGIKMFQAI